jgi:hypothetical protein
MGKHYNGEQQKVGQYPQRSFSHRGRDPLSFVPSGKVLSVLLLLVGALLVMILVSQQLQEGRQQADVSSSVAITVYTRQQTGTSNLQVGTTHVDDLQSWSNPTALANAEQLNTAANAVQNTLLMGGGIDNIWPDPSVTNPAQWNWSTLDARIQLMRNAHADMSMMLWAAPTWMVDPNWGQPGYTYGPSNPTDWNSTATKAPLSSHYADFANLAKQVALRYPDIHRYVVWAELDGIYNPSTNNWNIAAYTMMYNDVYDALKSVNSTIQVGGPYIFVEVRPCCIMPTSDHILSNKSCCTVDQRSLDAIDYWLANKHGADFIDAEISDMAMQPTSVDPFAATQIYTDMANWMRKQPHGGATLPIWWSDWYVDSSTITSRDEQNALSATALIRMVNSGVSIATKWGDQGAVQEQNSQGFQETMWSDTLQAGGGQAYPFYYTQKAFRDYFGPGTQLYNTTVSSPNVSVLASDKKTMLVNHLPTTQTVNVNGTSVTLKAYQVTIIDMPRRRVTSGDGVTQTQPFSNTPMPFNIVDVNQHWLRVAAKASGWLGDLLSPVSDAWNSRLETWNTDTYFLLQKML